MVDETVIPEAEVTAPVVTDPSAPESEATAAPDDGKSEPEASTEVTEPETPSARTFTQDDVDQIVGKRLASARRSWERESKEPPQPAEQRLGTAQEPSREQFETDDDYINAVADYRSAVRDAQRQDQALWNAFREREEKAYEELPDYEQVVYKNPDVVITPLMADVIRRSDIGTRIAYHLGSNVDECKRIAKMDPVQQAVTIGRLEERLSGTSVPPKKTTQVPPPITPTRAATTQVPTYDTTDERSLKQMSDAEWIRAENARVQKAREAQFH